MSSRPRRGLSLLTLVIALLVGLTVVPGLAAAESRAGGSVVVAEDETVQGLEAFGGSVVVRGTVQGDLAAFAGDVTIAETGRVTGDVEAAGGSVRIEGTVDGDVDAAGGSVTIAEGATVGGSLEAGSGTVRIDGQIAGDVTAGADTIVLGSAASVGGDLTYDGELRGNRGAVAGQITRDDSLAGPGPIGPDVPVVANWVVGLFAFLANLVLGALLVGLFPGFSRRVADRARSTPVRAGAAGLLGLVVVVAILVGLAVTIVGIPFAVLGALLFAVASWVAAVYGRIAVGYWLVSYAGHDGRWVALVVGLVVVGLAVRIPLIGWLVNLLVFLLGLGALALVARDRRRAGRAAETSADVDASAA